MGLIKNNKTVLVAPLDWGLGHATRCIPIVKCLLALDCNVMLASSGKQALLLKEAFPLIEILPLQGYDIHYGTGNVMKAIARQLPSFFKSIKKEHAWLAAIIDRYGIDLVISDNRYGLYTAKCSCILVTHQLQLQAPYGFGFLEKMVRKRLYKMINHFTECWVPDVEDFDNSLGKKLSHPAVMPPIPIRYVGWLTRYQPQLATEKQYKLTISLSGPEPQRTILENVLLPQLKHVNGKVFLIRGLPGEKKPDLAVPANVTVANHLSGNELQHILLQSHYFLTRSGYSTLMDLQAVAVKCLFVPTPGQTEQEYLANQIARENKGLYVRQNDLVLQQWWKKLQAVPAFSEGNYQNERLKSILETALQQFVKQ